MALTSSQAAPLLLGLLVLGPVAAAPPPSPPPPPPPLPPLPEALAAPALVPVPGAGPRLERSSGVERAGGRVLINGLGQTAQWRWLGAAGRPPDELWLPLEVLQERIGATSRAIPASGDLELEWYGRRLRVPADRQRTLGDEVAIDAAPLLADSGMSVEISGDLLNLRLPPPRLLGARPSGAPPGRRRVVLDLSGPALLRSSGGTVLLELSTPASAGVASLRNLAVNATAEPAGLQLAGIQLTPERSAMAARLFTLGTPARLVIDLPAAPTDSKAPAPVTPRVIDPRLQALLGRSIRWDRLERWVEGRRVRINAVRIDPGDRDLELRPLSRGDGMEGLSSLTGLARSRDALVAINGGFFNRIRRLPLGALRDRGQWLSGPILNRGAIGWDPGGPPRFGRLRLDEEAVDRQGTRWRLTTLNSGFVQRGLSRYTAAWGPMYRSLAANEQAVLVRQGRVIARLGPVQLAGGVPLASGDDLLVGRAGVTPPWSEGEPLSFESRVSSPVGLAQNVVGGGPLLRLDGALVLDGRAEGFSPAFLTQGAPRTVIGSDGRLLWLLTLEGVDDEGPTLRETAELLGRLGLRDALNLDGGSSTGLVMGGLQTVKGRGVEGAIHHGLGLVPGAGSRPAPPGG